MSVSKDFTLRVYAILTNAQDEILLINETFRGVNFTKFPGGGMEWGEGAADCIKRELHEELGLENVALEQFYTTDFFVESFFDTNTQVVSIYYKNTVPIKNDDLKFAETDYNLVSYKWMLLADLKSTMVTFPIDKKVVELLLAKK